MFFSVNLTHECFFFRSVYPRAHMCMNRVGDKQCAGRIILQCGVRNSLSDTQGTIARYFTDFGRKSTILCQAQENAKGWSQKRSAI